MKELAQPKAFLVEKPNRLSTVFAGKTISLKAISRAQGIDMSYLSRIFSGKREPTLHHTKIIAAALGMGIEDFLEALDRRIAEVQAAEERIVKQHLQRVEREDNQDLRILRKGKTPAPRIPGLRAS